MSGFLHKDTEAVPIPLEISLYRNQKQYLMFVLYLPQAFCLSFIHSISSGQKKTMKI